jgi:hypothetical protein
MSDASERIGADRAPAELPPLPDGGLGQNMPAWLRRAPVFTPPDDAVESTGWEKLTAGLTLPDWLESLAERVDEAPVVVEPAPEIDVEIQELSSTPPEEIEPPAFVAPPIGRLIEPRVSSAAHNGEPPLDRGAAASRPSVTPSRSQDAQPARRTPLSGAVKIALAALLAVLFIALWMALA